MRKEKKERKKERKKENDHVELNPNLRERCAQTGNIDIISITRHNNTSYRKALSNKKANSVNKPKLSVISKHDQTLI